MRRRDFLKRAAIGAGVLASGVLPGKGKANPSNTPGDTSGNRKQGAEFYKIDAFSHYTCDQPRHKPIATASRIERFHSEGWHVNKSTLRYKPGTFWSKRQKKLGIKSPG